MPLYLQPHVIRLDKGKGCGMECEAKSKPRGTANLFRRIHLGDMKSVGKK